MRIYLLLTLLVVSCGSTVAAPRATQTPSPIPWIADIVRPTPVPTPTVPPPPIGTRSCAASDVTTLAPRGQGAGGWTTRAVIVANATTTPCVIAGPTSVAYLDGGVAVIARTGTAPATWSTPGWVVLDPGNVPAVGPHVGQAWLMLQTYGDCEHATMNAIAITFTAPTGTIIVPVERQGVGGRCDAPGQPLTLGWGGLGPTQLPDYPSVPGPPFSFRIEAPVIAFAGEPMRYVVWIRNTSATAYRWDDGCPIYLEWLGGRELTPTEVPGRVSKPPPERTFAGFAKEPHSLNCTAAGIIAPGPEVAFEMFIDVPRDALGPDTLRWELIPGGRQASSPIEFLPPRR